jgi:hypothetical protein
LLNVDALRTIAEALRLAAVCMRTAKTEKPPWGGFAGVACCRLAETDGTGRPLAVTA